MTACWRLASNGDVLLDLKVTPGAARAAVGGLHQDPDGQGRLALRVTAPPEDGKANAAVLAVLSKALGVPKSALALASGEKGRHKTVRIAGRLADETAAVTARLDALAAAEKQGGGERA